MRFDIYTARNHKQLVRDAIARAQRALEEMDKNERNLIRPDGWPRFTPPEEQEQRQLIESKRQEVLAERDQIIANAREVAERGKVDSEAAIARIAALQENPVGRLTASEAANVLALVNLLESGFRRSSFSDMVKQVQAATTGGNRDQQVACFEVLQRRIADLTGADGQGSATQLAQRVQLEEVATTLLRKLQDPGLARERGEHVEGLKAAEELLADVRAQDHPIRVAEAQEKLVASGKYGDRVVDRRVLHNIGEAPVPEMVEQA